MYTKLLRKFVQWQVRFAGHCDDGGDDGGGHTGHCY